MFGRLGEVVVSSFLSSWLLGTHAGLYVLALTLLDGEIETPHELSVGDC